VLVLRERLQWERWIAAAIGFAGVMIVVAPKLTGDGGAFLLVMLAASPLFAASFLMTKTLTRFDKAEVIVAWQAISVTVFSLPLGLLQWHTPSALQWAMFVLCGVLGSAGHYCLTRSFAIADISATQSVKFLELVWAAALGWLAFSDTPSRSTLIGGVVICGSTLWIARRESRRRAAG
jgi:drug/metabolite transporter (DMT)-like permease